MNLEGMTIEELVELKCKIDLEIQFIKKAERYKHSNLMLSGKELITYISQELGYNVLEKVRGRKFTLPRYAIAEYFRKQALSIVQVAEVLNMNHATISHALNMANILGRLQDAEYMLFKIKIENIIINFKKQQHEQELINIDSAGTESSKRQLQHIR